MLTNLMKRLGVLLVVMFMTFSASEARAFNFEGAQVATATLDVRGAEFVAPFAQAAVQRGDTLSAYCQTQPGWRSVNDCLRIVGVVNDFTTAAEFNLLRVGQVLWLPQPETAVAYAALQQTLAGGATPAPPIDLASLREQLGLEAIRQDVDRIDDLVAAHLARLEAVERAANTTAIGDLGERITAVDTTLNSRLTAVEDNLTVLGFSLKTVGLAIVVLFILAMAAGGFLLRRKNSRTEDENIRLIKVVLGAVTEAVESRLVAVEADGVRIGDLEQRTTHTEAMLERVSDVANGATHAAAGAHDLAARATREARVATNLGLPDDWQLIGELPSDKEVWALEDGQSVTLRFLHETKGERHAVFTMVKGSIQGPDGNMVDGLRVTGIRGLMKPIAVYVYNMVGKVRNAIKLNKFDGADVDEDHETAGPTALSA